MTSVSVSRTRVKICGITRPDDALAVVEAGADALGLVFFDRSPRNVGLEQARAIVKVVPAFVTVTALFVDPDDEFVDRVLTEVPVGLLQFHGRESADFCRGFGRHYVKAIGMQGLEDLSEFVSEYYDAAGFLLDSHAVGESGGTGKTFDWSRFPTDIDHPLILAGGLHPGNVAEAILATHPYAVDLSSGVESSPGIKDARLIRELMSEVRRADNDR